MRHGNGLRKLNRTSSHRKAMLQNMMNNYIDQSKNLFVQMQDQMQDQTRAMFSNFPFTPGGSQGGGRKP